MMMHVAAIRFYLLHLVYLLQSMAANVPKTFHPPMQFAFPKRVFGSAKKEEKAFRAVLSWIHFAVFKSVQRK